MNTSRLRKSIFTSIRYIILSMVIVLLLFPIVWSVSQSLKTLAMFFEYPFKLIPDPVAWQNYRDAWNVGVGAWFKNSLIMSAIATMCSTFLAVLTGYVFAKFVFKLKLVYFYFIIITMLVPWQLVIIPLYEMAVKTKLLNTYVGLITPFCLSAFGIFLMRQFITVIPDELILTARVDGAPEITIFLWLIIPLSKPAIATLSIFTFLSVWDEYYWPLVVGNIDRVKVLTIGIAGFVTSQLINYNLQMAAAVISFFPMLLIFLFLQRFIVKGFLFTGFK